MATATKKTTAVKVPTIGEFVTYIDSKGHSKPALITGTPESVQDGTELPVPSEGQLHLMIFSPISIYPRFSVPSEAVANSIPDFTVEGLLTNYWK